MAQPGNTQLPAQVATVFKGETLRSMLLNAYGWWKVSQITYIISLAMFGLGTCRFLAGVRLRQPPPGPQAVPCRAPAIERIAGAGHEAGTAS